MKDTAHKHGNIGNHCVHDVATLGLIGQRWLYFLTNPTHSLHNLPIVCTIHHIACTIHHIACTIHHIVCTIHQIACTIHHNVCTIHQIACIVHHISNPLTSHIRVTHIHLFTHILSSVSITLSDRAFMCKIPYNLHLYDYK